MTKRLIVDKNDNVIGAKERSEIDFANDIYRVSALWLTNSKGEILLAQRMTGNTNEGGLWGPAVAGTVEEGESYEQNIYKEAEEEIGLSGVKFNLGPKGFVSGRRNYFGQWYTAVVDRDLDDFRLQPTEVESVKWISPELLVRDVKENPTNYIANMSKTVEQFCGDSI